MTKFCEGCPNRGDVRGEIDGAFLSSEVQYQVTAAMGRGAIIDSFSGELMIACDKANNLSQPFKAPASLNGDEVKTANFLAAIIDSCPGPAMETKGFLKRRQVVRDCGATALNSLRLHPDMRRHYRQQFEILALPLRFENK